MFLGLFAPQNAPSNHPHVPHLPTNLMEHLDTNNLFSLNKKSLCLKYPFWDAFSQTTYIFENLVSCKYISFKGSSSNILVSRVDNNACRLDNASAASSLSPFSIL